MTKVKKSTRILCIALAVLLISCIGASLVQTGFGNVTMKDLRWETESGHQMSALLFIPDSATVDNPAPLCAATAGITTVRCRISTMWSTPAVASW